MGCCFVPWVPSSFSLSSSACFPLFLFSSPSYRQLWALNHEQENFMQIAELKIRNKSCFSWFSFWLLEGIWSMAEDKVSLAFILFFFFFFPKLSTYCKKKLMGNMLWRILFGLYFPRILQIWFCLRSGSQLWIYHFVYYWCSRWLLQLPLLRVCVSVGLFFVGNPELLLIFMFYVLFLFF